MGNPVKGEGSSPALGWARPHIRRVLGDRGRCRGYRPPAALGLKDVMNWIQAALAMPSGPTDQMAWNVIGLDGGENTEPPPFNSGETEVAASALSTSFYTIRWICLVVDQDFGIGLCCLPPEWVASLYPTTLPNGRMLYSGFRDVGPCRAWVQRGVHSRLQHWATTDTTIPQAE